MNVNKSLDTTPNLANQIIHLGQLTAQIHETLMRSILEVPESVWDGLDILEGDLARLRRYVQQLEDESHSLKALTEITRVVNSSLELSEVLQIVMDTIIRLTGAERGFLMLRDKKGDLAMRVARNWEQVSIDAADYAISHTIVQRVAEEGKPVLTTNARKDPRFDSQDSVIAYNLHSILCVPLVVKDEITGVIYADNRIRAGIFTQTELDLLYTFANQAAVAIENARLFESVSRTLAEVTGLKNLMDNVFASIASGVITADVGDRITLCNNATESILGRPSSELIGSNLKEILPHFSRYLSQYIARVRETDQPVVGLEVNPVFPGRGKVSISMHLSPLKDASHITQGVAIVLDDLTEKKRLEAQQRLFSRMLSPAVIDQLNSEQLQLGGNRATITTLFADVRGFTGFSEDHDPEQLVAVLNRYLTAAVNAILEQEGTIDKFLGDAVMAWFNAPIPQVDHTLRAVSAALAICSSIRDLHQSLPPEYHLSYGLGIHFGEAVLGMVGSELRMDYTAIGDSVNTARRIQEKARPGQILISEEAYAQISGQVRVRAVEPILAKGKRRPLQVYEVIGRLN